MRIIRKSSFLFTLFITCLNFTATAYLNGQSGLNVDWYRGDKRTPTDNATYTGQPISVIKSSTLDGVEIKYNRGLLRGQCTNYPNYWTSDRCRYILCNGHVS